MRRVTTISIAALSVVTVPSEIAYPHRPYKTFPTVNNAAQIIATPLVQPTIDSGRLSPVAASSESVTPAASRTARPPRPGGADLAVKLDQRLLVCCRPTNAVVIQQMVVMPTVIRICSQSGT